MDRPILYACDPWHDEADLNDIPSSIEQEAEHLRCFLGALLKLNQRAIIKLHPRDTHIQWYFDFIQDYPQKHRLKILQKVPVETLLNKCSVLVTVYSTVALEAMLHKVPVVILNLTGFKDTNHCVALHATNENELVSCFRELIFNQDKKEILVGKASQSIGDYFAYLNGSGKRIADLLKSLI